MFKQMISTINSECRGANISRIINVTALGASELRQLLTVAHGIEASREQRDLAVRFVESQCCNGLIYLVEGRTPTGMSRLALIDYDEANESEPHQLLCPNYFDSAHSALSYLVERTND